MLVVGVVGADIRVSLVVNRNRGVEGRAVSQLKLWTRSFSDNLADIQPWELTRTCDRVESPSSSAPIPSTCLHGLPPTCSRCSDISVGNTEIYAQYISAD